MPGRQVQRIAADVGKMALTGKLVSFGAGDLDVDVRAPRSSILMVVEQADERADGATGVVVFCLAQQNNAAASLEIAKVHVVAERRADDPPARYREHDLGLRVGSRKNRRASDFPSEADCDMGCDL